MRNVCRALSETARRHPKTAWLRDLPFDIRQASPSGAAAASSAEQGTAEWFYGYDPEQRLGWRLPAGLP
eukprot:14906082-Alexandrium_andersonii.AAC.1